MSLKTRYIAIPGSALKMPSHSLAELAEKLFCAVISDCLDQAGVWKQAFPPRIRPLDEGLVMVGRARTALYMDVYAETPGENPYDLEIKQIGRAHV